MEKSENKLLISIVMPVYNAEKYMDHAIDCILQQTYSNWELILVDNCSTDSTVKKCEEWISKDDRIFGIFHEKNLGLGQSRTDGINFAHGDYIGFMDSDDYIHTQFLEIMATVAERNDSKIVMCNFVSLFDNKKPSFPCIRIDDDKVITLNIEEIYKKTFSNSKTDLPFLVVWNKIFKAEIAKKINVTFQGGEDTAINFKAYNIANKMDIVDIEPLYYYVRRSNSEMNNGFNINHFMLMVVYFQMEKETFNNHRELYHYVSYKTYKKILSTRCNCRNTILENETKQLIENEFSSFRKRFWHCKKIPMYKKIIMDIFYYMPFTYSLIKR